MKKSAVLITGVLVLAMGATSAAWAHGGKGKGPRGGMNIESMFEEFDANGDGKITADEVAAASAARFAEADTDTDGFLSAEEVAAHAEARMADREARMKEHSDERRTRMFERLDTDEDGKLSAEEAAARGPAARFDRMLERLDADGDGALSLEEVQEAKMKRFGKREGAED